MFPLQIQSCLGFRGYFWTKSCLGGVIWQQNCTRFLFLRVVFFPQNGKSLLILGYILKTFGHACVHIVNLGGFRMAI